MSHPASRLFVPLFSLGCVLAACSEGAVGPDVDRPQALFKGGPPSNCDAFAALSGTLSDLGSDGLLSDGGGAYVENVNDVESHINGPTGNFSIWTTESSRSLSVTITGGPVSTGTIDRVYTNNHSNECGLRLSTLPASGTTAVLEAEQRDGGTGSTIAMARWGKDCAGALSGPPITVAHPDASTIVLTGTSGQWCTKLPRNKGWRDDGDVGPFVMTLTVVP